MSERYQTGVPKYNWYDYKAGRCTDLEYYKAAYGGPGSVVTKHYDAKDLKKDHPFFVVKRAVKTNFWGERVCEFKVYDMTRGLLNKEEQPESVTNKEYWNDYKTSYSHLSYVDFLADTFAIITSLPKRNRSKSSDDGEKKAPYRKTKAKAK